MSENNLATIGCRWDQTWATHIQRDQFVHYSMDFCTAGLVLIAPLKDALPEMGT